MKNEIEQQIFEKMKAKDFGESMCNETKLNVLKWTMQQLHMHDVVGRSEQLPCDCNVKLAEATLQVYCPKCYKTHKMK